MKRVSQARTAKSSRFTKWKKRFTKEWNSFRKHYTLSGILIDPSKMWIVAGLLFAAEVVVNALVIRKVPYTEIDWKTYMQQVDGFLNGTLDYSQLKGDTGPLVYPAGFLYVFSLFYHVTDQGRNLLLAQYMFAALYLMTILLVFKMYLKNKKIPPYGLIFMCCSSYRIHSIYVLRLFNDPVAVFLFYVSVYFLLEHRWTLGSIFYSLAVSVKMNILLFAPALWFLLISAGGLKGAIKHVLLCGFIQVILGLPFLLENPVAYLRGSFDVSRVFLHEWTVNWRFLPEDIFVLRSFHLLLLGLHLLTILIFLPHWKKCLRLSSFFSMTPSAGSGGPGTDQILFVLFTSNLIGMAFSRSLHYQFYVWYFHSLPFLLWCVPIQPVTRLFILGLLELSWNTYPSTVWSSLLLHACHLLILVGIWWKPLVTGIPQPREPSKEK